MRFDVAVERGLTPLIGRERELGILLDRFSEVKAVRGQVVFITGEAGMGKSRLVLECRRALAAAGDRVTWLEGRCITFGESIPLLPIIDQRRENFSPTTLLKEVSRAGAFSCARDRHGDDAVACLPRTVGPHPPGRL